MQIKRIIRTILPRRVGKAIGNFIIRQRERRLSCLPISQAFDEVYRRKMWQQGNSLSGVGSEGDLADRYIELVRGYTQENGLRRVVDGGCGDFAVGSRLAPLFERYVGLDVSHHIIEKNKQKFADLCQNGQVTFEVADMIDRLFPPTDLILIRQVLQHLTNNQIKRILKNIEASQWRRVLITEEVSNPLCNEKPNLDLPSHTIRTRVSLGSGVFIEREPFNAVADRLALIGEGATALVVYELSRDKPKSSGN